MAELLRNWKDSEVSWSEVSEGHWRAYFNYIEIGGYSLRTEPIYAYFGNTKFITEFKTEGEAKTAIEQKFYEWLRIASGALADQLVEAREESPITVVCHNCQEPGKAHWNACAQCGHSMKGPAEECRRCKAEAVREQAALN